MAPPSFDLGLGRDGGLRGVAGTPCGPEPRAWQRRLIQLLRARLVAATPGGQDVLLHAGPGAGKTLGALLAFQQLQREGRLERFVVFCHRSAIGRQWIGAAARLGLVLREWDPGGAPPAATGQGLLLSYQAAALHRSRLEQELVGHLHGRRWLAIGDEVHHLGLDPLEPKATAWGHAFSSLSGGAQLRLGLTGTPFRADNLGFCSGRRIRMHDQDGPAERIIPDLCVEPRALIAAGDVRPLEFRFQDGWVEHGRPEDGRDREISPLSAEQRESWRARNLRRAIRPGDRGGIALRLLLQARRRLERVRLEHPGAGGLVVARDIGHAGSIADLLAKEGDRVHLVHSQDPEAAQRLAAFQAGEADWLVSIDMCAEGFDAPRLRVVAYLTTVVTRSRFVQAITRAVRMDGDRSGQETIPRLPSYVFAPADPLLISYARGWTVSEPYVIRPRPPEVAPGGGGSPGSGQGLPLQALADDAGRMLSVSGPVLPLIRRQLA
ncbi:DEAD/DEAH box helicase family protein [Cyanobium sp. Cruz CV13-4-11]|uniref:DEAD/DEAH box helicase n=1 Tax=unclassified Cyanobium TaxID=2627006 RepID=UPI0020CD4765|nr:MULTISPECIES: DEAD/DEAH box helicase family protein [unclassified Cyanobium]MCP9901583.1 DEAD/DEAH box helicase family protein [Cyanobium sp. Cruz CV11-17]MCP9918610.1 DEAD/DEAH box helicase family protein [Cyanobium sp. Cruz CV13-4-11]